eukprot:jgi/Orpsp1_1/1188113/evm.model.d7180000062534.1
MVLILIFLIINLILTKAIIINNENELINVISENREDIIININSTIEINTNFTINSSYKKISIIGDSNNNSIFNFRNKHQYIYFNENLKFVEIKNISIYGNIYFNNNENILLSSVRLSGSIDSYFDINNNNIVKLDNFFYEASQFSNLNCIKFGGNVEINNSNFRGSSSCKESLFNYDGLNKFKFSIKNSYFSGEYQCSCLNIDKGLNVYIENSIFEKGYALPNDSGGAGIKIQNSNTIIKYCKFNNNLSANSGGSFFLKDNYSFTAENIELYNTTSLYTGSMAFITNSIDNKSILYFKNIRQIKTGNMNEMKNGGLIMCIQNYAIVKIENYYAEDLVNLYKSGSVFHMSEYSSLDIKNIEINNVRGNGIDGLIFNTYNANDISISVYNYTISNIYQSFEKQNGALLWFDSRTKAILKK